MFVNAAHDWSKWRIDKKWGLWWVRPPIGTFWGRLEAFCTFDDARTNYIEQTAHVRSAE